MFPLWAQEPHPVAAFPSDGLLCSLGRRHTPYGNQTDYRIFELNKRLQNWTEVGSWEGEGWPGQYFGSRGPHHLLPHVAMGQGLSPPSLSTQLRAQSCVG